MTKEIKTKNGEHIVKLEDVLKGITFKKEVKETPIAKSTEKTDSYVGYYADIDNDGDVDGIIYADMVVGNTKSGCWNNDTEGWSDYNAFGKLDESRNMETSATDSGKWFIPSKAEWSAFGEEIGITSSNYGDFELSDWYWLSSQSKSDCGAYGADFGIGSINSYCVNGDLYVRLSTTF